MIVGQNSLLNQYSPTWYVKALSNGQIFVYDAVRKAFVNTDMSIGNLFDVSITEPVQNGQAIIWDTNSNLWINQFVDYNTLLNLPTSSNYSFIGLSDTAKPSLPDGYVKWNSIGTQLVYSTSIPAASITGLATVAYTGNYNDLIDKPPPGSGSVTSVSVVTANGVSGTVSNPNITPAITLTLGNITPASVVSSGPITASNLSGVNTGDQTITLTGDVTGSGTGTFLTTLNDVNTDTGTFGSSTQVPVFEVDDKGRILSVTNVTIAGTGDGTVTSIDVSGGTTGLTTSGGPVTTSGVITLSGVLSISSGGTGETNVTDAINALLPDQFNQSGKFLMTDGTDIIWETVQGSGLGTVTSVSGSGSQGVTVTGSPITSAGTLFIGLGNITPTSVAATGTVTGSNLTGTNTGDQTITLTGDVTGSGTGSFATVLASVNGNPGSYGNATQVSSFTVNAKGLITGASNTSISITPSQAGLGNVMNVLQVINGGGAPSLQAASGPPTGSTTTGALYIDTSVTNGNSLYRYTGTTWEVLAERLNLITENSTTYVTPVAAGTNSVAIGTGAETASSAPNSLAIGLQSLTRIQGGVVQSSGRFSSNGDAQSGRYMVRTQTIGAIPAEMFVDGQNGSVRLLLIDNATWTYKVTVTAHRTDSGDGRAGYTAAGVIYRGSGANTTALQGSVQKSVLSESNPAWDINISADSTNGALKITVTGEAGKTIRWVALVETVEVTN